MLKKMKKLYGGFYSVAIINPAMRNNAFLASFIILIFLMILSMDAHSATYYVRTDGGTATECTGTTDAAYSGSGTNQACAFEHPFWALSVANAPNRMVGGDTLIIGPGEYMMGFGAPNTPSCSQYYPWDCYMRKVPSGTTANPTRILGKGWDTGCSTKPQLWGTERTANIFDLRGSSNVEIQCLDITDHSSCMDSGPDPATVCNRNSYPYGAWALIGIVASDSQNVLLKNLDIHGLRSGIFAGRLTDWTIEDTEITANSFVGWDGDIGATTSSNNGTITFKNSSIKYSGCGETYPGLAPHHCYSQDQGGYGDAIGTNKTGGDWVFDHVDISYNVSDGVDLLYHNGNGSITISHSRFEGNAGNQVKVATDTIIDNSKLIGTCAFFSGKSFTSTTGVGGSSVAFNHCRAAGSTLAAEFKAGMQVAIYNSTITSNGDVIVLSSGSSCVSTDKIVSQNNIYIGGPEFNNGGTDISDLYYASGSTGNGDGTCGSLPFVTTNDIIWATKYNNMECVSSTSRCVDPKIAGTLTYTGADQDVSLLSTSPAINAGIVMTTIPTTDFNNYDRGSLWDIGALEYGSVATTADTSSDPVVTETSTTAPPAPSTPPSTSTGGTSGTTSGSADGSVGGSTSGSTTGTTSTGGSSTAATTDSSGSSSSGSSSGGTASSGSSDSSATSSSSGSSSTSTASSTDSTSTSTQDQSTTSTDSSASSSSDSSSSSSSGSSSASAGGSSSGASSGSGSSSGTSSATTSAGGSFADAFTPPSSSENDSSGNSAPGRSYRSRRSAGSTGGPVTTIVSAVRINPLGALTTVGLRQSGTKAISKAKRSGWWIKSHSKSK